MEMKGKRSLALLLVMPVLLLVELGIGWGIFKNVKETTAIESNVNKLDLYLITNTKCISNSESAQRGYLLTGDLKFYDTYLISIMEWVKNIMSKSVSWLSNNQKVPVEDRKEIMNIFRSDFFDLNNIIQIYQMYSNVITFLLPLSKTTGLFINFYNQTRDGRFKN